MRLACSLLAACCAASLAAQEPPSTGDTLGPIGHVVQSWMALRVSPGHAAYAFDRILDATPVGWERGPAGTLVRTRGSGSPHRVIACALDEPSYVVSAIRDDGYLRVHVAGPRATRPFMDASHMGQRVFVLSNDGTERVRAVPGVFAVRSVHLSRGAATGWPPDLDDLWLDVGARTAQQVADLGISLLDPVFRDAPAWSVADAVVGPNAAARAGCVAVSAASEADPDAGTNTFVIAAQSTFGWRDLQAVLGRLYFVDSVFVVHPDATRPVAGNRVSHGETLIRWMKEGNVPATGITVASRFAGTNVETVAEHDLELLVNDVMLAAGRHAFNPRADAELVQIRAATLLSPQPRDSMSAYAELLARLTDIYAVSGNEEPVRDVIAARLPGWARDSIVTDTAGNVMLAMGPDRDTVVFIAHMDEVGFQVVRAANGVATLRQVGGFYPWLWTGQTALLHLPGGERAQGCRPSSGTALRGVFLPPDSGSGTRRELQAWFGDALFAAGDVTGARVTSFKCASRLAGTRFTARSIDDRLGSAALILALDGVTPSRLTHKVIFVWSVREETGLYGATAAASELGESVRRVYAVDTFVSSDSPLETERFARAAIGAGAVARALDNSSVTPPAEVARVAQIAREAAIPLQIGTTNGGNDGSVFVSHGAVDVPVGWPLRYSHSPVEVIDLRDLRSLARLVSALAMSSR